MCEKEIEKLRVEKEKVERQLAQEQHNKQRRECVLDEHRKRIRDEAGICIQRRPYHRLGQAGNAGSVAAAMGGAVQRQVCRERFGLPDRLPQL